MFEITNFVKRNATWFLIGLIAMMFFLFIPGLPEFLQLIILTIVFSSVVIFIASYAHYTYTPINLTDWEYIENNTPVEIQAARILGKAEIIKGVFIGICILAGCLAIGVYFVIFAK